MCSPFWTLLPPPSPYHPSGSTQCTSPKHPASCIEPGLASRFIHDFTCFNAILPNLPTLSLSHRVHKPILYISVSFAVSNTTTVYAINISITSKISHSLFLKFIFNWSIVALRYCVGFCHTSTWINYRYSYFPFHLKLPPTSHSFPPVFVITEQWFELYICVSIPDLQIPSRVLALKIPHVCVSIRYLYFSFWLTSLCTIGSRFIQHIRTESNVFVFIG